MPEPKRPNSLVFNEAILNGFIDGTLEPAVEAKVANFLEARPDLLEKISAKSGAGFLKRLREVQHRSAEKSLPQVKAEIVDPATVNRHTSQGDSSIPTQLANYAGYKIVKELGRGGMGVVYLAKNIQLDRLEVLKVLNERLLDHAGAKERFLREIRAVSKLSHANIVTSYSILPLHNLLVFAMEYVHGIDLHQYTQKFKPLPVGLACSFAKQIAAGLQHAHEKGLVHRDIKPSNVMLFKSDGLLQLKILDFGLAKATSEEAVKGTGLTQDGTMLGTPEYMSPEQTLNAAKADIRADIYSLGCTLYYMLTGKPPFTGTHGAVLLAHAQREPTPLNLIRPEIPVEIAAVVGKMLAKDLRKRYQTPAEVAQALLPFVNQARQVAAKPPLDEPAVSNTDNDLNGPQRETSVEAPLAELSQDTNNRIVEPQADSPAPAVSSQAKGTVVGSQRSLLSAKSTRGNLVRFLPATIALGALVLFGALWQVSSFTSRTPDGAMIVENMPADAEVVVDGQQDEVSPATASAAEQIITEEEPALSATRVATILLGKPNWRSVGDEIVYEGQGGENWILFGDSTWTDYSFELEFMADQPNAPVSMLFRSPDDSSVVHWGVNWPNYRQRRFYLEYRDSKSNYNELRTATEMKPLATNMWHKLSVKVEGQTAQFFINDVEAFVNDRIPYRNGRIGVRAFAPSKTRFRNLKVLDLDGKELWIGPPVFN